MRVFWDIAPCSLVEIDRCFRGAYCFLHQGGLYGMKSAVCLEIHRLARTHTYVVVFIRKEDKALSN
jgi:hypothetical protein